MMRRIGGMMVGGQTGAAVGALAEEVVSSTDVGLPLGPQGTAALLPAGVAAFGAGLSVDLDEVRLFLALREAAHHRLFGHVPWLRARLLGAVEDYARGIKVDASALRDAMPQIDPSNPEALNEALSGAALFQPEDTPEQKAALARLETVLALVEGWVATVVAAAASDRLPQADALAEAIRRRRATGGPAERTFATLVGLELRPRRLREAADIWQGLTTERGVAGRDAVWAHPDLLPTADDFDDPDGFVRGRPELDISDLDADAAGPDDRRTRRRLRRRGAGRAGQQLRRPSGSSAFSVHSRWTPSRLLSAGSRPRDCRPIHSPAHSYPQRHAARSPRSAQRCPQARLDQPARRAYLRSPGVPGAQVRSPLPGKGGERPGTRGPAAPGELSDRHGTLRAVRPMLRAGLLPVWRDRDTVQIGIDPRRAVAISGTEQCSRRSSGLLDGSRDREQVIAAASQTGVPPEVAEQVIALLAAAGALVDLPGRDAAGDPGRAAPAAHAGARDGITDRPGRRRRRPHPRPASGNDCRGLRLR